MMIKWTADSRHLADIMNTVKLMFITIKDSHSFPVLCLTFEIYFGLVGQY